MNKTFAKIVFLLFAIIIPLGFQNCSPSSFNTSSLSSTGALSLSSQSVSSCGSHASGSRWWEEDPVIEPVTCGSHVLPHRYYVEKTCNNGTTFATGQRVADSTNPICQTSCQSTTQPWTVTEGYIQIADMCTGGVAVNAIYKRQVQYSCVNNVPTATGQVIPGDKIAGGCLSNSNPPTCQNATGQTQAEGMVWQERTTNFTYNESCTGGQRQVSCERYFEYRCTGGVKQFTSRAVVSMNCQASSQCTTPTASCTTTSGTHSHLSTWTERVNPDFVDAGTCTNGGDLMITSERLQTYQCNNGTVVSQQVVRGANISSIGQCGPKSCTLANGTGEQRWVTVSGSAQWSACEATSCNSGYVSQGGACVLDKKIRILTANYGDNFGFSNNATGHMGAVCNNQKTCAYYITTSNLGDPKWGWSKDFRVYYDCLDGIQRMAYVNPEANTSTVYISCQ